MLNKYVTITKASLQHLLSFIVLGLLTYLSLNLEISFYQIPFLILVIVNLTLIPIYIFFIDKILTLLKLLRCTLFILSVVYAYFATYTMKYVGLSLIQSVMVIISITLIMQALSANFDLILANKYKITLLDISLIFITIAVLTYNFRYNLYSASYSTYSTMLSLLIVILSSIFHFRIPSCLVFLTLVLLSKPYIEIYTLKALTIITIYAYIQGYITTLSHNTFTLVPSYNNTTLIFIIVSVIIASIMVMHVQNINVVYLIYIVSLCIPIFNVRLWKALA